MEWPGYSPNMNPIEDVWNIMKKEIGNHKPFNKKIYGSEYVKCGRECHKEELLQFNAKENCRSY